MRRIAMRAAARYVAGDAALDAVRAAGGRPATIGYWDSGSEAPADVASRYAEAVEAAAGRDIYVSIKAPAVEYDAGFVRELGALVHLDAVGPETVDRTWELAERIPVRSVTLPGRWRRSVDDVARVADLGVGVRVVKGQFPSAGDVDPRAGFVAVVRGLVDAGVTRIQIATHDRELARLALALAPGAELEQLYGLPPVDASARVYVPYGTAFLPYAAAHVVRNPRVAWWLLRDLVRG